MTIPEQPADGLSGADQVVIHGNFPSHPATINNTRPRLGQSLLEPDRFVVVEDPTIVRHIEDFNRWPALPKVAGVALKASKAEEAPKRELPYIGSSETVEPYRPEDRRALLMEILSDKTISETERAEAAKEFVALTRSMYDGEA